ncbi:MAG: glycosyltransferase family 9 protein [Bacteroidetes bacterium]|nr:glycosyltransferase family 9 protein [Bacteroidota bacterium]
MRFVKFLVIQTAFIGDVILATSTLESLHQALPNAQIDILVRKGNEALFLGHPFLHQILVWNKKTDKIRNLFKVIAAVRKNKYDYVINLHRYASSGFITFLSAAQKTIGFHNNPLSFLMSQSYPHKMGKKGTSFIHETERNHTLIADLTHSDSRCNPRLYPSENDYQFVTPYQRSPYICIAPSSVWFTKQWPKEKWIELIDLIPENFTIYLLGAPVDLIVSETILSTVKRKNVFSLCGKLNLLQSAALMEKAYMNYVNDSAPLHIATAMNAPVAAIFCSTIPEFGFGPLNDNSYLFQEEAGLKCRPCGLHGHEACPKKHFRCAALIDPKKVAIETLNAHVEIS